MTLPNLVFAFAIASACGFLYHLIRGGRLRRLVLDLLVGWAGFFAGHFLATWLNWTFLRVGSLNLGAALTAAALLLIAADVLTGPRQTPHIPT